VRKKNNNVTKQYLLFLENNIDSLYKTTVQERLTILSNGVLLENELIVV
jgi:hypothetical protein